MKYKIRLAIAITFFFGIATYILLRKVGSENVQADKETVERVVNSPVKKLPNSLSSTRKNSANY